MYEKLEIEPHKRSKLLGVGGINLKKLFAETGVQVKYTTTSEHSVLCVALLPQDLNYFQYT